ncbi:MAG: nitronate monooxygenase [Gammaproteobacteria bacterium]|nr:nitronate monooxygenase [Gammaproteobacteria bacterium]
MHSPLAATLGIVHPLLSAPMAGVAGGRLAAAVSRAGGPGFIGGGYCGPEWSGAELAAAGDVPVGIGFIGWRLAARPAVLDLALAHGVRAVLLSFGEPAPFAPAIRAPGARLVVQVQSVAQARAARDAGADVVVAQGSEAGGHAGQRATLPLVPAVVDAVAPLPVVAAGGIADGRGLAAALMLGAAGGMLGSRFYACAESLAAPALRAVVVAASGDDSVRSPAFDRLRGWDWPPGYALRTLANAVTREYAADPAAFERDIDSARIDYARAVATADTERAAVIVGEAADLVGDCPPAADLVVRIVAEAAACLAGAAALLRRDA